MNCREVDELGAAFALDAVDPTERRAIRAHLEQCGEEHVELRQAIGVGVVIASALEPVAPSPGLRKRVMATISATAQEPIGAAPGDAASRPGASGGTSRPVRGAWRGGFLDWLTLPRARALAAGGVAAALVLAVASASLYVSLSEREQALRAAAAAIADGATAFRVEGEAGRGYVVDTPGAGATLVLGDLRDLPDDRIYELWLLPEHGAPVAAGTFTSPDEPLAVVEVEDDLAGYTTLAVTIERERVEAPTSEPVLLAPLEG